MLKILNRFFFGLRSKKEVFLIDSEHKKELLRISLINSSYIGIDTEFSWRKTYFPELSLLQISTESKIFLIDFLKIRKINFLESLLVENNKEIIMHSSRSDTTVLNTNLNIKLENVFDIQIAEKFINGGEIKNYGFIVSKYTGFLLDKSETYSNWSKRPLTPNQIAYASEDVEFLIQISEKQKKILRKRNLLEKVLEASRKEAQLGNEDLFVSRLKKLKQPSATNKILFMWRENHAIERNIPPSFIFKDKYFKPLKDKIQKRSSKDEINEILQDTDLTKDFFNKLIS